jgi:hypothetical protein
VVPRIDSTHLKTGDEVIGIPPNIGSWNNPSTPAPLDLVEESLPNRFKKF